VSEANQLQPCVMRFFVDERSGCVAVRDRTVTDPEYNGLHYDTVGVIEYWPGKQVKENCPTCGHQQVLGWVISEDDLKAAHALCDRLNSGAA
jgi:hypothetical protein